jgi:hypothetical protein
MRGGIVLTTATKKFFVPASAARELRAAPEITRILGAPEDVLGVALTAGEVVPVVRIGVDRRLLLLCEVQNDLLGIVGFTDARAGLFPATEAGDGVELDGESVPALAVTELRDLLLLDRWSTRTLNARISERRTGRGGRSPQEPVVPPDRPKT